MKRFTRLYFELDATNRTGEKLAALQRYFSETAPEDAAWALAVMGGGKVIRAVSSRRLRDWVSEATGYEHWLVSESYDAVGDLAETLALLLPPVEEGTDLPLHTLIEERVLPLPRMSESQQRAVVARTWAELDEQQCYLFHKLILGSMRVGVASGLVVRALAGVAGVEPAIMAHRLSGQWAPTRQSFLRLMRGDGADGDPGHPYPFFLAHPLENPPESLGPIEDWQAEWKWDGIRAQLIQRDHQVLIWSRGDELITRGFPEIRQIGEHLPDGTVLDGEILAWEDERPLPFALLQRRINRKREEPRLWDEVPLVFMAYDLLEASGVDQRGHPLQRRRAALEELVRTLPAGPVLRLSPILEPASWEELSRLQQEARERGAEGLMLKRRSSGYGVGRPRGDWWKWKVNPFHIDAVLIYARHGNGKRASLFTDYTFGVWEDDELVPVAKAYSGLTDAEIRKVDAFVRRSTIDRFGRCVSCAPSWCLNWLSRRSNPRPATNPAWRCDSRGWHAGGKTRRPRRQTRSSRCGR